MKKIKITCVIHSLSVGGMERVMSVLLNDFSMRENVQVDLVLIGRSRDIAFPLNESVRVHRPGFAFNNNTRNYHTVKTLFFLRKTIKEIQPDSVLSFGEMWNNLVLLALSGLRYPVYISDRSQPDKDLGKLHNFLRRRLYPGASGFIAQTTYGANNAKKNGLNTNIKVIGNPIKQILLPSSPDREKIVLSVGRLIKTKHFDDLIRMFASLDMPGWKLIIIGGNAKNQDQLSELRQLIKALNAEDKVALTGEISNVEEYYKKASVFAFSSSSEGFPNVIGEALSYGLPVVAYDCVAGPADMIAHKENGFLVKTHDHEDFSQKLRLLMENSELRESFSQKATQKTTRFSKEEVAEQFYKFITGE